MPRFAANLTMLFNEVDLLDRFEAAAGAGFRYVEYLFPYDNDKEQLRERLERHGLTQVLHNMPAGDFDAGDRGVACDPSRVAEFQDGVGKAIEYAPALGCKQVNCLAGIPPAGVDAETCRETVVSNLRYAAAELEKVGVGLLIEALNIRDVPGFYLTHTDQARSIINEVGSPNLHFQYDVYHMQIMEGDLARTIEANLDIIRHLQLADNPGRNEPGTGEINYPFLFDFLDRVGYGGAIGCEYKPATTTEAGLGWVRQYLE